MREIEIKARVDDLDDIRSKLIGRGQSVSEPVTQHDVVWGLEGEAGEGDNTAPWLRVRTETRGGKTTHLFTLKRSVTNQLDSIEHETAVADPSELSSIIKELGFVPYSDLTKTRQKVHVGDIEICLDEVERLGSFIEVEKLIEDNEVDYHQVIEELWTLLGELDVDRNDEVTEGYDVLINQLPDQA